MKERRKETKPMEKTEHANEREANVLSKISRAKNNFGKWRSMCDSSCSLIPRYEKILRGASILKLSEIFRVT